MFYVAAILLSYAGVKHKNETNKKVKYTQIIEILMTVSHLILTIIVRY